MEAARREGQDGRTSQALPNGAPTAATAANYLNFHLTSPTYLIARRPLHCFLGGQVATSVGGQGSPGGEEQPSRRQRKGGTSFNIP